MASQDQNDRIKLKRQTDSGLINSQTDPVVLEALICSISTYRFPDILSVGDDIPDLDLVRLSDGEVTALAPQPDRPLMVILGSYT